MTSAAMEQLLELQQVDTRLDRLAVQRRRAPEHELLRAASQALELAAKRRAAAETRLSELDARIAEDEEESIRLSTVRTRLQGQLRTIIAPREAEALMHEIETTNARRSELDDAELGHLEEQEQLIAELAADEADEPARMQSAADAQAALDAVLADIDGQIESATRERDERRGGIAPALLTRYERLRANLGGVGVAKLEGRQCSGCHLELSPAELDGVKSIDPDAVVECPQCSRLLVR
ncbi:MAG: C4-type zinc ribbon domain-containing protein [Actinomycetota bacterium]|nr:C4-type zinc ribbon domain-containing protein [Actinomycetota bacterium]